MNRTPYVLARELTDLPAEVRTAPAPVIPEFDAPFALRLADLASGDPETVTEWMARPHLLETWEQAWTAERRRLDWTAQLAGTYSRPCLLSYDFAALGQPELGVLDVSYVELYRPAKDEIARLYEADPHDVGFHIATADTRLLGRGIVSEWMNQLGRRVLETDPRCRRLMCEPDYRNTPMRKALEKNGWQNLGEFDIRPDRRIALYTLTRDAADQPVLR